MLHQQPQAQGEAKQDKEVTDWIRTTSYKMRSLGEGLREFLRFTEKIFFSPEPKHQPDQKFMDELVGILNSIDETKKG